MTSKFDIHTLNGTNGFKIIGRAARDYSGFSVDGAGDFNNDGYDDIIIGAKYASPNGVDKAGEVYVVYGGASGLPATFDLNALNGSNGFRIEGVEMTTSSASPSPALAM